MRFFLKSSICFGLFIMFQGFNYLPHSGVIGTGKLNFESPGEVVKEYTELLESYANSPSKNDALTHFHELIDLFNNGNFSTHFNDLFEDADLGSPEPGLSSYLQHISKEYKYALIINFSDDPYKVTRDDIDNKRYVVYRIKKTLQIRGKSKSVLADVIVDLRSMKIDKISDGKLDESCKKHLDKANQFYSLGNYLNAKEYYVLANICNPGSYIKERIKSCNSILTQNSQFAKLKREGDRLFDVENYSKAITKYKKALQYKYDQDISNKIEFCENEINFLSLVYEGDRNYNIQFYVKAKDIYSKALTYHPRDQYVLTQIRKCKQNSTKEINVELEKAVGYWNRNKLFEAFEILYRYKDSGQLTKVHNYMLGALLFDNRDSIRKKMREKGYNLTKANMSSLGSHYIYKSVQKSYLKAILKYCNQRKKTIRALGLPVDCDILYNR